MVQINHNTQETMCIWIIKHCQGKKETCNKTANKTHESTTTISDKTVATSSKQNSMHHILKNKWQPHNPKIASYPSSHGS